MRFKPCDRPGIEFQLRTSSHCRDVACAFKCLAILLEVN